MKTRNDIEALRKNKVLKENKKNIYIFCKFKKFQQLLPSRYLQKRDKNQQL